ncbi:conserved hypothetical protein [uncultured Eubacteriales bacterium]|uniref:tRNA(Met) cytidine acetate ligase n=1 Tax=uncultured Eubacteriales bacterium TaxID=172733 RepID=A0A212J9F8_9FIRM|nr:conserved hypothetical protein [uncultured Eubacteriales bacterium]
MGTAGVVTEYNPFHTGHAHQLAETRKALGEGSALVCVMSGNFVQRGECSVLDKWSRSRCALQGGADLVLENPTPWAAASAETFARGAVGVLAATGVVDTLSFGSEAGTLEELRTAARCLDGAEYRESLRRELDLGLPFAAARERAARSVMGAAAACLATPNNNLAVEYLRALPPGMAAMTVKRVGAAHDGAAAEGFASASALRALLHSGELEKAEAYLPAGTMAELTRAVEEGRAPASLLQCERAVLARLRTMTEADFAALPDGGAAEGLPARLVRAAVGALTLEEFCTAAKTKRYAHARIRRLALWAFLGLTEADRPAHVPYVRVLGMNHRGRELLSRMKKTCVLPVITKPAHARRLEGEGRALFETEARCTNLFALCTPQPQPCGLEWTTGPVIL